MPKLGEIKSGTELGKKNRCRHIWTACIGCGKERWVMLLRNIPKHWKCLSCGSLDQGERGKGYSDRDGYKYIRLSREDPLYPMTKKNRSYTFEHRIVMARHLGRCLTPDEIVHHLNGVKDDNRLENLILTTRGSHIHLEEPFKKRIANLEDTVRNQAIRIRKLELILQGQDVKY